MPVPKETPEINQPNGPKEPEVPQEDPQVVPDELPPGENSPGTPAVI